MASEQAPTPVPIGIGALIGRNIRVARLLAGKTQNDLAVDIGLRESQTVSNWERGLFKPSDENLAALCHVLRRDLAWFYTDHQAAAA